MNIMEGDGEVARENRLIGSFTMEPGTLHKAGAEFTLHWRVDENFDLHLTASDPVIVQDLIRQGLDQAAAERGVVLHLIGLKDHQIAKNSMVIGRMWDEQLYISARTSLIAELARLNSSLAKIDMNKGKTNYLYVNSSRKWADETQQYSEDNFEEVQVRIKNVTVFIKISKQFKKIEGLYESFEGDDGSKREIESMFAATGKRFEELQNADYAHDRFQTVMKYLSDLEKELKKSKTRNSSKESESTMVRQSKRLKRLK